MYVLVACEESQRVCSAFRRLGHIAYSCDIIDCSGGHPEWHIKGNALDYINGSCTFETSDGKEHTLKGRWDLLIAHPPCTYLSNAGAVRMRVKGKIVEEWYKKAMAAKDFFMHFLCADCKRIAVENPTPMKIVGLPPYTQAIQPYEYGHPYSKRTCLWLKGLPNLKPTKIIEKHVSFVNGGCKDAYGNYRRFQGRKERDPKLRSKTFEGIAEAMAAQWGGEMNLKESIVKSVEQSGGKIQSDEADRLEKLINRTFFLERDIDKEISFLKMVMTRGQETQERRGLHASEIKTEEDIFCMRRCILSKYYKRLQGEEVNVRLKRIFEEGNAVHEKYQRLFIRAGWSRPMDLDYTMIDKETGVSYTPDILCYIPDFYDGVMIGEIKSVNPRQYEEMKEHTEAYKQLQLYMYFCIKELERREGYRKNKFVHYKKGFVLCENKGNQDFKVFVYDYDPDFVNKYIERLNDINMLSERFESERKMVPRKEDCTTYDCECASKCYMRDACWNCGMGRVPL